MSVAPPGGTPWGTAAVGRPERPDKPVAAAEFGPCQIAIVAERAAQRADVDLQIDLGDRQIRPDTA